VPDVFLTFLKIAAFFYDTPVMSALSQCRSGGMGVVLGHAGREELGDDKENNSLFLMMCGN
jgi:hypothetical protein